MAVNGEISDYFNTLKHSQYSDVYVYIKMYLHTSECIANLTFIRKGTMLKNGILMAH